MSTREVLFESQPGHRLPFKRGSSQRSSLFQDFSQRRLQFVTTFRCNQWFPSTRIQQSKGNVSKFDCLTLEDRTDRLHRNVITNYQSTLRTSQMTTSHLHRGGSLKSRRCFMLFIACSSRKMASHLRPCTSFPYLARLFLTHKQCFSFLAHNSLQVQKIFIRI